MRREEGGESSVSSARKYASLKLYRSRRQAAGAMLAVAEEMSCVEGLEVLSSSVVGKGTYGFIIRYRHRAALGIYLSRPVFAGETVAESGMASQAELLDRPGKKVLHKAARCLSGGKCFYVIIYPA